MAEGRRDWSQGFKSNGDAAAGCQYIRWMGNKKAEHGNALLVLLVGVNSIAASIDPGLDPEDAIAILQQESDTIAALLRQLRAEKCTHGARMRPNR